MLSNQMSCYIPMCSRIRHIFDFICLIFQRLRNSGLKIFRVLKDSESPDCDLVLSEQVRTQQSELRMRVGYHDNSQMNLLILGGAF